MTEFSGKLVDKNLYSFPKWLAALMGLRNVTRAALAADCGVEHSTVSRWLDGSQKPTGKNVVLMAHSLRVSEVDLRAALANENSRTEVVNHWNAHMVSVGDLSSWRELWGESPPLEPTGRMFGALTEVGQRRIDPALMESLLRSLQGEMTIFDILELLSGTIFQAMANLDPDTLSEVSQFIESVHLLQEEKDPQPKREHLSDENVEDAAGKVRALLSLISSQPANVAHSF